MYAQVSPETAYASVREFGVAVSVLIFGGIFFVTTAWWLSRNILLPFRDGGLDFLKKMGSNYEKLADNLGKQTELMSRMTSEIENVRDLGTEVKQLRDRFDSWSRKNDHDQIQREPHGK